MENLLSIGKILNFHGIAGEVKVGYTQGKEVYFDEINKFFACTPQEPDIKKVLTIQKIRFHKKNALIKFKEINSIDEATEFKGAILKVSKDKIEKFLETDEFYINDLKGLDVFDQDNKYIGKVSNVSEQGGGHILSVKNENHENLIPFVKDLVPKVNIKENKIIINAIPGLIEL